MVLCDPSYEMKSDYARVVACRDGRRRVCHRHPCRLVPDYSAPEARDPPRKLKTLA
jgi:23S rRNA (adenine2030-N6)-methyltransferase